MICNVILTAQNGRFIAHVAELPDCKAEAESRDQALALIQKRLEEIVRRSEIVQLEIPDLEKKLGKSEQSGKQIEHATQGAEAAKQPRLVQFSPMVLASDKSVHLETPWEYFGIFKDDPTWMPMLEEIERRRDRQKVPKLKKEKRKKGGKK
jgi:predicted RNase H-like HicB family nuclease